ncbi:MAG: formate dehydrogenase subunit gamma [Gammaproteobacteria bacterium]|nr:formate dehydrogenase subunit gamma [Gammaproteobacteria bacterium]
MATKTPKSTSSRRKRAMLWSFVIIVAGAIVFPSLGYVYTALNTVQAQASEDSNPRANYWRAVREGYEGYSAVTGRQLDTDKVLNEETNVLIQNGGHNWRQLRNGPVATYGGWGLFLTVCAILLFFAKRGRVELEQKPSGMTVPRWSVFERTVHWYTATLFIILSITGLSILFGRAVLIPLFGLQGFSAWASFAKPVHDYMGPFFSIGVLFILIMWIRHNIPTAVDMRWFGQGGGIIGRKHPSAGRLNGGEKLWFWIVVLIGGVVVCVSGFILDFPGNGQTRELMQWANIFHAVGSLVWIAVFFGHAYIGTIGTEGALDAMSKGRVGVEWARQHHDLWYDQVKDQAEYDERMDSQDMVRGQQPS